MIQYASYSNIGGRPRNEDATGVRTLGKKRLCAVLADGLGGHGQGEIASQTVVSSICEGWEGNISPVTLTAQIAEANRRVLEKQSTSCHMKTTVVVLVLGSGGFAWANVGDSRLYHFRNNKMNWRTTDHSASQLAVFLGQIKESEIRFHADRARLYRALGQSDGADPDAGAFRLKPGRHAFLLCSDGFWEYVNEDEMERTLSASASAKEWLDQMRRVLAGKAAEDHDNNSAIAVWMTI